MYINSNLSPREVFRMHGALPADMIERLLDAQDAMDVLLGVQPYIVEAIDTLNYAECPDCGQFVTTGAVHDLLSKALAIIEAVEEAAL